MNRKLKAAGASLVAVFAMGAVLAGGVQAANFKSEAATTYFKGEQVSVNVFTTTGGTVKCKKVTFTGEATGSSLSTVDLSPTYAECTAFGQFATVTAGGCKYRLNAEGYVEWITSCAAGSLIVHVSASNCTVTVPNHEFTTEKALASYSNGGSGATRDFLATTNVNQITYVIDGPGGVCGTQGTYVHHASFTGTITTKGYSDAAFTTQVGVWVE